VELHEVRVSIDKDGNVSLQVNGIKGTSCLDVTKALEEALGNELEREMTAEAYEETEQHIENRDWLQNG
jgi:hypothetical protein